MIKINDRFKRTVNKECLDELLKNVNHEYSQVETEFIKFEKYDNKKLTSYIFKSSDNLEFIVDIFYNFEYNQRLLTNSNSFRSIFKTDYKPKLNSLSLFCINLNNVKYVNNEIDNPKFGIDLNNSNEILGKFIFIIKNHIISNSNNIYSFPINSKINNIDYYLKFLDYIFPDDFKTFTANAWGSDCPMIYIINKNSLK